MWQLLEKTRFICENRHIPRRKTWAAKSAAVLGAAISRTV